MSVEDQISEFFSYFEKQIEVISNLYINQDNLIKAGPEDQQIHFYQKVLIVTALDTLAGIRFSKEHYPGLNKKNRERFIRFITEYACWDHGQLVSTPFLIDGLSAKNLSNSKLSEYLIKKMASFNSDSGDCHDPIEFDETPTALLRHVKTEKEEDLVWHYQHYALFYRYRNFLVHEARTPGYAMEGVKGSEDAAFYHGYIGNALKGWHLAYPINLFVTLLTNSIKNLKAYFIEQNQDPINSIGDTKRW